MTNKYRYFSDLHGKVPSIGYDVTNNELDEIAIIAGDVSGFGSKGTTIYNILNELTKRFKEVIFVPGNHEYYGTHINTLERKLKEMFVDNPKFILLQNGEYIERDGVRIIGATLWADVSDIVYEARTRMNDYRHIRTGPPSAPWQSKLHPNDTIQMHFEHLENIKKALNEHDGKSVVITHHAPSMKSVAPAFSDSNLNSAYATDIELDKWPEVWIHGHIHNWTEYEHNGSYVYANPHGYPSEYTGYSEDINYFII